MLTSQTADSIGIQDKVSKMTANASSYSIGPRNLRLNSAEDAAPIIEEMNQVQNLTEVTFSRNSVGVEAGRAFAEALKDKKALQV